MENNYKVLKELRIGAITSMMKMEILVFKKIVRELILVQKKQFQFGIGCLT